MSPETSDRWLVVTLRPPPPGEELLLLDALHRLGARAVDREGERFIAWFTPPASLDSFLAETRWVVLSSTGLDDPWLEWRWESGAGWKALWEEEVIERDVSSRIVVAPVRQDEAFSPPRASGHRGTNPPSRSSHPPSKAFHRAGTLSAGTDAVVVRLLPGLAFGTAEHATTRSCLRLLDRLLASDPKGGEEGAGDEPGPTVLDIGTGSGILAVAAALLGARMVVAVESDQGACAEARANIALNEVADRIEVSQFHAGPEELARMGSFDGILANIMTEGLLPLFPGLSRALAPGGWVVVSGVPRAERNVVLAEALHHGLALEEVEEEEGWWSALLRGGPVA